VSIETALFVSRPQWASVGYEPSETSPSRWGSSTPRGPRTEFQPSRAGGDLFFVHTANEKTKKKIKEKSKKEKKEKKKKKEKRKKEKGKKEKRKKRKKKKEKRKKEKKKKERQKNVGPCVVVLRAENRVS
jgi:hypothetical protein